MDDSREVSDLKKRLQEQDAAHRKTLGELTEKAENARNQLAQEVVALKQQLAERVRTERESRRGAETGRSADTTGGLRKEE